jgi:hypothetical protein
VARPGISEVFRFCFLGSGRRSVADVVAVLCAWGLTLAILLFNALFGVLLEDGNLLIRGVGTLVLFAPLLGLYARGKSAVLAQTSA